MFEKDREEAGMETGKPPCNVCGGVRREILIDFGEQRVERCLGCGAGVLAPMPTEDQLSRFYDEAYFDQHYSGGLTPGSKAFLRRISQQRHRVRFFRPFCKKGRVLDLGCGMGYFLYACREFGYEVQGTDISSHAADYARHTLDLEVTVADVHALQFEVGSFEVITMWHSLEHTRDPRGYLEKALQWLTPDGVLVIDVPNYEGTDARCYGADWDGWSIPFHLHHFSPSALQRLLSNHGLRIIRHKNYHSEYVKQRIKRIPAARLLARLIAKCYSGSGYAVVARSV
jgi:SAM-dependent methyltransferase